MIDLLRLIRHWRHIKQQKSALQTYVVKISVFPILQSCQGPCLLGKCLLLLLKYFDVISQVAQLIPRLDRARM